MSLTLNHFLLLVLTLAAVVLVTVLVLFLLQLKKTIREGEKALEDIRTLTNNLNETSKKVNTKIDDMGEVLEAAKKTAVNLSESAWFVTSKVIRPNSKLWPLLFPLVRLGWRQLKKKKEDKNG